VAHILQRVYKKTRKSVQEAGVQPSDRALHRIRIKSKHLRYASEAFAEVVGKRATSYALSIECLQTMLGDQHDGVVALQRLRTLNVAPTARFAAGELAMMAAAAGNDACEKWRAQWKSIAKRRSRFW
jgi:CHAD domain-containing protein